MFLIDDTEIENISIVYLWVDGSDKRFLSEKSRYCKVSKLDSRNRNSDELLYSIRSLQKNLKWWKGDLFIVTNNQIPEFIDENFSRVHIINQNDIIPRKYLPTYNCWVIEAFIHKIPNITSTFIYLNDDYFFGNNIEIEDLFVNRQYPKIFFENIKVPIVDYQERICQELTILKLKVWLCSVLHSIYLINKQFKKKVEYYFLKHTPYIWNKYIIEEIHCIWEKEIEKACYFKERSWESINIPFLYTYYAVRKKYIPELQNQCNYYFTKINNDTDLPKLFYTLKIIKPKFYCLNDEFSDPKMSKLLKMLLSKLYPIPSEFEKKFDLLII